jgi:transposase
MGVIKMNEKERLRKAVFEMVKQRHISLGQASIQCELSYRQALRIYKKYLKEGDVGLTHQSRGQRSNRKNPHQEAIIALYRTKYEGFGPTLASEYLLEEGYAVHHETLRQWLLSEGLWKKQRKRNPYRQRREPKAQFGELIQIDGSIHDWLGKDKHDCLLNMVDDATSKTLAILDTGETTRVVFIALWKWIKCYGIPLALYVDLKNVYISPKDSSFSYVQIACHKLGIRIVKARSPQAKGRVERSHAVYQDRFVKALRLNSIDTIDNANELLEYGFVDNLNKKFEKPPRNPQSAHRPLQNIDLNQILCWEYERKIQHDWTFSFQGQYYQIEKKFGVIVKPKNIIKVRKHLDNSLSIWFKEKKISFKAIPKPDHTQANKVHQLPKDNFTHKNKKTSHWYQSNSFIFGEPDKTREKIASIRKGYNLTPPKNYNAK